MGFDLPESVARELSQLVGVMVDAGYMQASEPGKIPHLDGGAPQAGVVYGPLREFPVTPEFVLLWLTPAQAMLLVEATGTCHWTTSEPQTLTASICRSISSGPIEGMSKF